MEEIKDSLERYVKHRIETGGFLRAVLENNLFEVIARADVNNVNRIQTICMYIYNNLPLGCYGSKEKVEDWLQGKSIE